jgi:DNA-binding LacI/PurR family transcriptional regulator
MPNKRATITDVAREAGVSKATVSAVLNDRGTVKESTRLRVRAAIETLNYRPTQLAPGTISNELKSLGIVVKEIDNPYYADVVLGARARAEESGYSLVVLSSEGDYNAERRAVELMRIKQIDGLIAMPVLDERADLSHFFELKRRNYPFVLLEAVRGVPASLVDIDNVEASRRAAEHLISLGHTRIIHFAGPGYSMHTHERVDGVRRACSASQLVFGDDDIIAAGAHLDGGYRAALAFFRDVAREQRPTAVTCYNDLVAVGVLRALHELGLRVPEDVSVVGFDDIPLAEFVHVPLTTVRVPTFRMGTIAADMLITHVESKTSVPVQKAFLEAPLVVRASTRAPARVAPPRRRTLPVAGRALLAALLLGVGAHGASAQDSAAWRPVQGRLLTRWAAAVRPDSVLPEYPRPQLVRPRWQNLNGVWDFAVVETSATHAPASPIASVKGGAGPAGPLPAPAPAAFTRRILVPFAPEAALSGVGLHAERVAYRRQIATPRLGTGERLLLHLDACDWHCTVYVNGGRVADHKGGYDAIVADVTDALRRDTTQELVVVVFDPTDAYGQPRGKQVSRPEGIWYTPVTGLWQSVWLEPVPASSIDRLSMTPDVAGKALRLTVSGRGTRAGQRVAVVALANGAEVGRATGRVGSELRVPVPAPHLWGPDDPFLYDLRVTLLDGDREVDGVTSYFGMRTVGMLKDSAGNERIALNGKPVFQFGPLDQGWWPDGLYTAPTDSALRSDIVAMKSLGFTMVRKHIKVEPARWYYWADRLGLPVWQDMPSGWNDTPDAQAQFVTELRQMIEGRHNSPAIVMWVPFNEKWGQFDTRRIVGIIEQLDPSRLVNDVSGWQHSGAGDIIDVHRYQGPQAMRGAPGKVAVVGEFGGLGFKVAGHAWAGDSWGYGGLFTDQAALQDRYALLVKRLFHDRDTHGISAGVYTQLTDVEVELNGFFTYDRAVLKFDSARTAAVNRGLAPYVLPELPEFTDSVRVTVSQGTPTAVRYTLDGSEPTVASPLYRAPFTLHATTTVRARSFVNGRPTAAPESRTEYRLVAGRAPVMARVTPGLSYAYYADTTREPAYRMNWPVRWQVERPDVRDGDIAARRTGTLTNFSLSPRDTSEMFAFRYTGYLRVPRTGVYSFLAKADDGAALWIGSDNVFWSVGQSPKTTETWGQVALQAGLHPITLTYFQAYGPMALELYVEGPGLRRQRIPSSMLFHDPTLKAR